MKTRHVLLPLLIVALVMGLTACGGSKRVVSTPSRAATSNTAPNRSIEPGLPGVVRNSAPGVGCYQGKTFSDGLNSPPLTVYACPIQG
jgi:hypothetical protein